MYGADKYYREVKKPAAHRMKREMGKTLINVDLKRLIYRCLHTDDEFFLKSMREAIHEILTDVSDSFSNMIDMALANEIRVCEPSET